MAAFGKDIFSLSAERTTCFFRKLQIFFTIPSKKPAFSLFFALFSPFFCLKKHCFLQGIDL